MTLLSDIIDSGEAMPVAALLRKVKILAARLDQPTLAAWASNELGGYPHRNSIPEYRGPWPAEIIGRYRLPFTNGLSELPIPPMAFPAEQRNSWAFKLGYDQPIAELEELGQKGMQSDGHLQISWPADLVAYTNYLIQGGAPGLPADALLVNAYQSVSPQHVQGVVDAVRNRLLDLALGLEKLNPQTGEQGVDQPPTAAVQPIVNHITAQNLNMVQGSTHFTQTMAIANAPHDEAALMQALQDAGLSPQDIEDLRFALSEDRNVLGATPDEPGPHVQGWLGRMTYKAAALGGKVGVSAAGGVVAGLVKQYFRIA